MSTPTPAPETVESPEDALALSLDLRGKVDLELIQDLLGLGSLQQTRKVLGELVFDDPETGQLVTAADYLSGDVRAKLAAARAAAIEDDRYAANVAALEKALPADVPIRALPPNWGLPGLTPPMSSNSFRSSSTRMQSSSMPGRRSGPSKALSV